MGELLIAERQDLQDIANKLKAKTGKTDGMSFPNGFKEAIDNISGEVKLQDKVITENGTYQADSEFDGLGSVTVEVANSGVNGYVSCVTQDYPYTTNNYLVDMGQFIKILEVKVDTVG